MEKWRFSMRARDGGLENRVAVNQLDLEVASDCAAASLKIVI
jgi:hypothetical protein